MATYFKPVQYDSTAKQHKTVPDGSELAPSMIPVSAEAGNTIVKKADGVFSAPNFLSTEAGNLIRFGNDGGLFIDSNDILSNEASNALGISAIDKRVVYKDNSNAITGVATGDKILSVDQNNALHSEVCISFNGETRLLTLTGNNGVTVCSATIPSGGIIPSTDENNLIEINNEGQISVKCSSIRATREGNQVVCDQGKLFVNSDYGTM